MRMSCNGCRVLRKGCSENCSIRPCLQWIKSPESQANATVFLAKFYGRAGLVNLINAGPQHLRPAVFRSLLYEACGRIVNPIYGSVGLLWSGSWQLCQAAVESVLKGEPITPINSETAANGHEPPLKAHDIRHVSKDENSAANERSKPIRCRTRKVIQPKPAKDELSHGSSVSHVSELVMVDGDSKETESMVSEETVGEDVGLELTLGLQPVSRANHVVPVKKRRVEACDGDDVGTCKVEWGVEYPRKGVEGFV